MEEVWKEVDSHKGLYEVSNLGRVKSWKGTIMKPQKYVNGYLFAGLSNKGTVTQISIHRLVAIAFIPKPEGKYEVNHINEDKTDNTVQNLQWLTHKENINHGTAIERRVKNSNFKGQNNPMFGIKGKDNTHSKPVFQIDDLGNVLREFESAAEAASHVKCNPSFLSAAARGLYEKAKGFKWKYKDLTAI